MSQITVKKFLADVASIDQQITELERAGWKRARHWQWISPGGSLYLGPHGAWKAMGSMANEHPGQSSGPTKGEGL